MTVHSESRAERGHHGAVGLLLAAAIVVSWLFLHIYGVFFFDFGTTSFLIAAAAITILCWLYVGLFIVAHDCMHGSLVPGQAEANRWIGQLCVGLYAGFSYDSLHRKHMLHHRHSGTADDPDFADRPPSSFAAWYREFMAEYLTPAELVVMAVQGTIYLAILRADMLNVAVFWVLPALLSSVQLFLFGTYLPHRPGHAGFDDRHNARSNDYPAWLSLLTCFHFGYHHEHHLRPGEPWWRLPVVRRQRQKPGPQVKTFR